VIALSNNNPGNKGKDPQPNHGNDSKGHKDEPKERGRDVQPGNSGALTAWKSSN
jgi:hypothetical protein